MLEEILNYLKTKGIENLYIGSQPTDIDICNTLYVTGGYSPDIGFDNIVDYPTFQIISRGTSYKETSDRIENIKNILDGNAEIFPFIEAIQPPASLGRDALNRWEFSINFKVTKEA